MMQNSQTLGSLDISERTPLSDFDVLVAETQGRRSTQEDAFFMTAPPARPSNEMPDVLKEIFKQTQGTLNQKAAADEAIYRRGEGAATTVAAVSTDNMMTVAWCGDAPLTVYVVDQDTGKAKAHSFIREHNLFHRDLTIYENTGNTNLGEDVLKQGNWQATRDNYNLGILTHSLGHVAENHIGKEPSVQQFDLNEISKPGDRIFICSSCDGLFEAKHPSAFEEVLENQIKNGSTDKIAESFVRYAYDNGSQDNITAMVAEIPQNRQSDLIIGVADGHKGGQIAQEIAQEMKVLAVKPSAELMPEGWVAPPPQARKNPPPAPVLEEEGLSGKWGSILPGDEIVPTARVPDSVNLGQGFSLAKKELSDGGSVYRIVPPAGKRPDQAIGLAQQEGYNVHYIQFGPDQWRIGLTTEEFEKAWEQKQTPSTKAEQPDHGQNFVQEIAGNIGNFVNRLRGKNVPEIEAPSPVAQKQAIPDISPPERSPEKIGEMLNLMAGQFPGGAKWAHQDSLAGKSAPHHRIAFNEPAVAEILAISFSDAGFLSHRADKGNQALVIVKDAETGDINPESMSQVGRNFISAIENRTHGLLNQATESVPGAEWQVQKHANGKGAIYLDLPDQEQVRAVHEKMQNAQIPANLVPIRNPQGEQIAQRIVVLQDNYLGVTEPASRYVDSQLEAMPVTPAPNVPRTNYQPRPGMGR